MSQSRSGAVSRAEEIIAGAATREPGDYRRLAKELEREGELSLARRLLELGRGDPEVDRNEALLAELTTAQAVMTYKDPELPADERLEDAWRLLQSLKGRYNLSATEDQEVLGIAGAIWKYRFELSAQKRDLERSAAYYLRASTPDPSQRQGYTAINAAFVLDQLAALEEGDAREANFQLPASAAERRRHAGRLRESILAALRAPDPPLQGGVDEEDAYWLIATLAEALFGLGRFDEAKRTLARAAAIPTPDWQKETTARQLARLALLRAAAHSGSAELGAREALAAFTGGDTEAVEAAITGKIGVALSGGGLRASLFHIGVLAQLAECDLLRHVECISCVSGGSVIGTHYYLELRKLLKAKADAEVTREDYIGLVRTVEEAFLMGVQRNIRTRVAAEWLTNLKMIFLPNYSRTLRVGELYESELFARVEDGLGGRDRWLDDLRFDPHGVPPGTFNPKADNWRRKAKVPMLVLNAATLNTGHNWQFTATWMGEPPLPKRGSRIDANEWLRRMYHREAPPPGRPRRIRLGHAVAASTCVPGLFEPLPLEELYPDRVVRLVDGGVHDNQGTAALLEQACSVLVVSDASGQMDSDPDPSDGVLGVPLRANSILQARVREAQFRELDARRRAGLLRGLVFLHLKRELDAQPVDWLLCQDPTTPAASKPLTSYRVQKHVQRRLAAIRTDLDSFSETEAYAPMLSGFRMAGQALRSGELGIAPPRPPGDESARGWRFAAAAAGLEDPSPRSPMMRRLGVADRIAFKVWRLSRGLQLGAAGVAVLALALLVLNWGVWSGTTLWNEWTLTLGQVALALVGTVVATAGLPVLRLLNVRKTLQQVAIGFGMATVGFIAARLHLHVFDRLFLRHGRLRKVRHADAAAEAPAGLAAPGE